jgi:hypothetical protein
VGRRSLGVHLVESYEERRRGRPSWASSESKRRGSGMQKDRMNHTHRIQSEVFLRTTARRRGGTTDAYFSNSQATFAGRLANWLIVIEVGRRGEGWDGEVWRCASRTLLTRRTEESKRTHVERAFERMHAYFILPSNLYGNCLGLHTVRHFQTIEG